MGSIELVECEVMNPLSHEIPLNHVERSFWMSRRQKTPSIDVIVVVVVQRKVVVASRTRVKWDSKIRKRHPLAVCLVGMKFAREICKFDVDTARGRRTLPTSREKRGKGESEKVPRGGKRRKISRADKK